MGSKERNIHESDPSAFMQHLQDTLGVVNGRVGVEVGKKKGYKHWQCCAWFSEPVTFADMITRCTWDGFRPLDLKFIDLEENRKAFWNSFTYCGKDRNCVTVSSRGLKRQATTADTALEVNGMLRSGISLEAINQEHPVYVMYNLDKLMRYEAFLQGRYKRCRFVDDNGCVE